MFSAYFDEAWQKTRGQEEAMPTVQLQAVRSVCNLLEAQLHAKNADKKKVSAYFGFAFIWGVCACFKSIRYIDNMLRDFFGKLHIPMSETVFEYYFNEKEGRFVHWNRAVPAFTYDSRLPFFSLLVPTVETTRTTALLDLLQGKPVFLTGSTGVGKSVIVQSYLRSS